MSSIYQPDADATRLVSVSKTLVGNNTAGIRVPIFTLTGTVDAILWGIVTTVIGATTGTAFFQLDDGTAQPDISLAAGADLSGLVAGSGIYRRGQVGAALEVLNAATGLVTDPAAVNAAMMTIVRLTKKSTATTNVEFVYSTTAVPTSGVIQFFAKYLSQSADGNLVAI